MKEPPKGPRPRPQPDDEIAVEIPEGPYDTALDVGAAPIVPASPATRMRRAPDADEPPAASDDALRLPPGALVAMRKSGGLLFSSREVTVYRNGRVTTSAIGGGRTARAGTPRRLTEAQLVALARALEALDPERLPDAEGRQGPDAFVYEIVARVGRASRAIEVFEGSIPRSLAPLIRQLNGLLTGEN